MKTVLVTGYAKAPQGTVMYEISKHAGIVLEINLNSNVIINAEFTFVTDLAKDFFRRLLVGYDLTDGINDLIEHIERNYYAPSTSAIIVALKAAYRRYEENKCKMEKDMD